MCSFTVEVLNSAVAQLFHSKTLCCLVHSCRETLPRIPIVAKYDSNTENINGFISVQKHGLWAGPGLDAASGLATKRTCTERQVSECSEHESPSFIWKGTSFTREPSSICSRSSSNLMRPSCTREQQVSNNISNEATVQPVWDQSWRHLTSNWLI